jgi:hypothetical protein
MTPYRDRLEKGEYDPKKLEKKPAAKSTAKASAKKK